MHVNTLHIGEHATLRMAQRNLDTGDIALVLRFGRAEHRTGVTFYFLGKRDVPDQLARSMKRLIGTTVIVQDEEITTVYRNRRALSKIKRKLKWHRPSVFSSQ